MHVDARLSPVLSLNVPQWFTEQSFLDWLNSSVPLMTWHQRGEPANEYSDIVVFVDPGLSGEGSDQHDMPDQYWNAIVALCSEHFRPSTGFHIMVRITNLQA